MPIHNLVAQNIIQTPNERILQFVLEAVQQWVREVDGKEGKATLFSIDQIRPSPGDVGNGPGVTVRLFSEAPDPLSNRHKPVKNFAFPMAKITVPLWSNDCFFACAAYRDVGGTSTMVEWVQKVSLHDLAKTMSTSLEENKIRNGPSNAGAWPLLTLDLEVSGL